MNHVTKMSQKGSFIGKKSKLKPSGGRVSFIQEHRYFTFSSGKSNSLPNFNCIGSVKVTSYCDLKCSEVVTSYDKMYE